MFRTIRAVVGSVIVAAIMGGLAASAERAHAADLPPLWENREVPVTGEILPGGEGLQEIDAVMKEILARHDVPAAGVAVTHDGKLLVARGYGWADVAKHQLAGPETLFALASVSKPITAVTALRLVQEGRLKLDDHIFQLLDELRAPPGHKLDPRLREITIQMLLEHAGGWNRDVSGDPSGFSPRVIKELNVKPPITLDQLIYYMNGEPLDFDPGTKQNYSNYGFMLVGRAIEHATGEEYVKYVQSATFRPMGIRAIRMAPANIPDHEVAYLPGQAKRYVHGNPDPQPPGILMATCAAGGWCGSPVALARFLTAVDGTRTGKTFLNAETMRQMLAKPEAPLKVRKNGAWFGLGWDVVREMPKWPHGKDLAYGKNGGLAGASTWIEHLPGGIDWVVFLNASGREPPRPEDSGKQPPPKTPGALEDTQKRVVELLRNVKKWPEGDLFEKYK